MSPRKSDPIANDDCVKTARASENTVDLGSTVSVPPGAIDRNAGDSTASAAPTPDSTVSMGSCAVAASLTRPEGMPAIPGFVVTREIARGGMGCVYEGFDQTLEREVAIKTLLPTANASRFVTESKITARLPHPNIPPVYALGTLANGSPYLAMKLIRGRTLADELKARSHSLEDLPRFVQIFEQIALAVGFAHAQGVIHRDLKPANVMVGAFGEVQVMDWGLAKSLVQLESSVKGESTTGDGELTMAGSVMGTPGYMAPEQARGEAVDQRADVFSLGGILTAILTGQPIFSGGSALEIVRRASANDIKEALDRLEGCAADRELVDIARLCIEVSPNDRPANGLAVAKLVTEYRNSVIEKLQVAQTQRAASEAKALEQAKRRKVVQIGASVIAAVLLLGIVGTSIGLLSARSSARAERKARLDESEQRGLAQTREREALDAKQVADNKTQEAVTNLDYSRKANGILGTVLAGLDPRAQYADLGQFRKALSTNLTKASAELDGAAIGDPLEVAKMQTTFGKSLLGLKEARLATSMLEKSFQTCKNLLGPDDPETLYTMSSLATSYEMDGDFNKAIVMYQETLRRMEAKLGVGHPGTEITRSNLSTCLIEAGKTDAAIPSLEKSLAAYRKNLGTNNDITIGTINALALAYQAKGEHAKALPLFEESLQLVKANSGPEHANTLTCMNNLALGLTKVGKTDQAIALFEETLRLRRAKIGLDQLDTLLSMSNLACGYASAGRTEEAGKLFDETLKRMNSKLSPDDPTRLNAVNSFADFLRNINQYARLVALLEENLKYMKSKLGKVNPITLQSMSNLALGYRFTGKLSESIALYEELIPMRKARQGADDPDVLANMNNLAEAYWTLNRPDKALPLLEETVKYKKVKPGVSDPDTLKMMTNLGMAYAAAGKGKEAAETMLEVLPFLRKQAVADDRQFALMAHDFGQRLIKLNQYAAAETMLKECLPTFLRYEPNHWFTYKAHLQLGAAQVAQKEYAKAEPVLLKAYRELKRLEGMLPAESRAMIPESLDLLIQLYTATEKPDEASKYRELRDKYPAATNNPKK